MNYINGITNNYTNNVRLESAKRNTQPKFGNTSPEKKQIDELNNITNDSSVKVPISYVKIGEQELPYGLNAHFYKLSNGQRVVILPKEGKTVLRSYVNTGSLNEPDNIRGISHYIEHNLFNGSEGLDAGEFFKTTDSLGAETNASTGLAETNYFISSNLLNDSDLEKEIKIHASMLETPKFAVEMLEKEKGIVNSEINMITSNPDNIAYNNTLKNLFNIKTTSVDVIGGTTDNITNLTREDVVNYFNNNYFPANMVTVVSGEVEPEETMKLISKYFNSNKKPQQNRYFEELKPIEKSVRQDIISDKTESPAIVMGFAGPKNNDTKSRIYTGALARLMFTSSDAQKLFKPLNANVGSMEEKILAKSDAPRAIMVMGETSEENCEKLLKEIYARIEKYQRTEISDEDLNIIKRDMKKAFTNMFESSFTINDFIGTSLLENSFKDINNYEKIIDEMTAQDLQQAAKEFYNLNKTSITVLHPVSTNKETIQSNYNKAQQINFTGANKKQAVNLEKVKLYDLTNNYRVVTYNSNLPDIHSSTIMRVEKPVIPNNKATYAILNEILQNGTLYKNHSEFIRQLEKDGVDISIEADDCGITAAFSSDVKDYDKAYKLYKELLESPRFTQETFEKAVTDVKDRISRSGKSPSNKLNPELYKASYTKEDILKDLNTLTLDEVKNTYMELINNANAITSIAGPYEDNPELKNNIFSNIAEFKPVKPYHSITRENFEPVKETKVLTDTDNKSQAKIVMAYKYRNTGNIKDTVTLNLMNYILGGSPTSRLFNDLREQQKLAYSVQSKISKSNTTGVIKLSIGTTTDNKDTGEQSFDNLQKSINGFKYHVDKMKKEKVSEEELNSAKLAIKNSILSGAERTIGKNAEILAGASGYYGAGYINKLLEIIDTITVDDIYNASNYVFNGKPIYSIVATKDTLDFNKEYLDKLGN